jgi:3',5'-cyclic AMP phosphodiesterase CpdA
MVSQQLNQTTLAITAAACLLAGSAVHAAPQSIMIIPDTQKYVENFPTNVVVTPPFDSIGLQPIFDGQVDWIIANAAAENVQFVTHVGDLVENAVGDRVGTTVSDAEWGRANATMAKFDAADLPYSVALGNHDALDHGDAEDAGGGDYTQSWDPTNYLNYYGNSRYSGKPWFQEGSPSGKSHYNLINMDGRDVMLFDISLDTPQAELDWAQDILSANRDKLAIVTTHRYLYDFRILAGRYGENGVGNFTSQEPTGLASELYDPDGQSPVDFFNNFVAKNQNIFAVICGHNHAQYHQVSKNEAGLPVYEILIDFQDGINGGGGFMGELELDFDAQTLSLNALSTITGSAVDRTFGDAVLETLAAIPVYGPTLEPLVQSLYGMNLGQFVDFVRGEYPFDPTFEIPPGDQAQLDYILNDVIAGTDLGDALAALGTPTPQDNWETLYYLVYGPAAIVLDENGLPIDPNIHYRDTSFTYTGVDFDAYIPEPCSLVALSGMLVLFAFRRGRR